jgi:hypothetical protein
VASPDSADETPTVRENGSQQRIPVFQAAAEALAEGFRELAMRKRRVLAEIDIAGAQQAEAAAVQAEELAGIFAAWARDGVGAAQQLTDVQRLRALEALDKTLRAR